MSSWDSGTTTASTYATGWINASNSGTAGPVVGGSVQYKFGNGSIKIEKKRKPEMNKTVMEMYTKTADAVLVDKWFGKAINESKLFPLLIAEKKSAILAEAKRLQAVRDEEYAKEAHCNCE